jgi:hypothetical protein
MHVAVSSVGCTSIFFGCSPSHTQLSLAHTTQNVATAEVADALGGVPGFSDVTVYGVSVPDCDGKVGMAAVVLSEGTSAE